MASAQKVRLGAPPSGSGLRPCILTWYDPALGGINSSHGQKDPHAATASGEPYDANAYTCAAPPSYSFGTILLIQTSKTAINVKVNDRGGAIQGSHFDLSRRAAQDLGVLSAGLSHGYFKVVSKGGGGINLGPAIPHLQNPLQPTLPGTNIPQPGVSIPNPLDALKPLGAFFKLMLSLFYPSTWERIGKAVIGFFLIMWGVHALLKSQGIDVVQGAKRAVIKTAEVAAVVK